MRLQRQLSDAKTGLLGAKEDLPPAAATAAGDNNDAMEILGFGPQKRSRLTTLHDSIRIEKKNVNKVVVCLKNVIVRVSLSFRFEKRKMMELNDAQRHALERAFDDPASTFQYAMPIALHRALGHTHPELGLTLKKVCDFVERRARIHEIVQAVGRRHYDHRLTVSLRPDHQWQCDLAYFHYGKRFILTKKDTFSRLPDAEVVANKSVPAVLRAFGKIIERQGTPHLLETDQSNKFFNAPFCRFCDKNRIDYFYTRSETKASMVERFNRTLGTVLE